jgi:hypothetical protein
MKAAVMFLVVLVLVVVVAAVSAIFHPLRDAPVALQTSPATSASSFKSTQPLVASGDCQSRYWGKVTGATPSVKGLVVVLEGSNGTLKTELDPNGLFGFAGLCAGDYAVSLQVAGKDMPMPNRVKLDGKNAIQQDLAYK